MTIIERTYMGVHCMGTTSLTRLIGHDPRIEMFKALRDSGHLPFFREMQSATAPTMSVEGRQMTMLGSNNYLGLSTHPAVVEGAARALREFGTATTGSRLMNGTIDLHLRIEAELAQWHGTEDAIVFTTGYQTNLGTIGALVPPGGPVVVDQYAHASIQDGCRLAGADLRRFRHNDMGSLRAALTELGSVVPVLVIIDGLYSMEGDFAPLTEVQELCDDFGAVLMVDEAHSVGLFGDRGTGVSEMAGLADRVPVRMGSLSKGLASTGGFVAGTRDLIDTIRGRARAFQFSTAGVPSTLGAALAAIQLARSDEGRALAAQSAENARFLRSELQARGVDVGSDPSVAGLSPSPIVPVYVGDDLRVIEAWRTLFDDGIYCNAAVHPAVPAGNALLRVCVMATHTAEQLEFAADAIAQSLDVTAAA
ncbi:aminotransferase class I/II-fold pyridoxal phosphate-dependent enzyme [Rhodococcus tibetensis]|uniref:8-amino-7-oxononanoate synthase n=1 Tax=Rhodococcus tibetensis TaxID=2965064 RepID=A0ABT1QCT0_9NOCA|nr:aminotransferase class I/II-fold pyridoxal phosphate-dependent enzyme [Rhodococcus sp. FXJ9.536]MCQ4118930.1 aminotransferase class I/II-fold pyridoxal phosphate-dependent enzyme [Rhodococcus sp. FXJ9.536]